MRKRTLKEKFYTGCGYSIFGALAFAFFLGLSVAYGIKTASIIVGAIVTVFWLILIAICLIEEGEPHATPLRIGGADDISNYMPACRSCNHYKATLDIEGFRDYLSRLHKRLMRDSIPYQVAERFGIVKYVSDDVKFYFEELRGGE